MGGIIKRFRLWRMQRALKFRLMPEQRAVVLSPRKPDMRTWPRRSGKTMCACLWLLLHHKEPIEFVGVGQALAYPHKVAANEIPDPDYRGHGPSCEHWTYRELWRIYTTCKRHRIKTCEVKPLRRL